MNYFSERTKSLTFCHSFTERGHICGSSGFELNGYCLTTVGTADPNSCSSIFHGTSYAAVVKSGEFNTIINSVLSSDSLPGYDLFRIGLSLNSNTTGEGSRYEWADGTPLIYHNFHDLNALSSDQTVCPSISIHDTTHWQAPACDTTSQAVGTLCQFGRYL